MQKLVADCFGLNLYLAVGDASVGNLESLADESLVAEVLPELDDAVLAIEDVIGVESSRTHVEKLLLLLVLLLVHF
jgi:hypothetical protein